MFERPPVDRIAARAIANRGCSAKVNVLAGDMLMEALPADADVHLHWLQGLRNLLSAGRRVPSAEPLFR